MLQAGLTVAFTAAIPIPGIGTAIGFTAGIAATWMLNQGFGKSGKSIMGRAKDALHKLTSWFS